MVEKKKTANFDAADNDKYTLAKNVEEAPLDSWDKEASSYHDQYAKNNSSPYGYGVSDLNYYGAYSNVPGYGMMWQPYFTGVGWDPFMNGAWSFYPGSGYHVRVRLSLGMDALSLRQLDVHPREWAGCGSPEGLIVGYRAALSVERYRSISIPWFHPGRDRQDGGSGQSWDQFRLAIFATVVNAGSAGMGIQRGSLDDLHQLNHQVAKTGSARGTPSAAIRNTSARGSDVGIGLRAGQAEFHVLTVGPQRRSRPGTPPLAVAHTTKLESRDPRSEAATPSDKADPLSI